VIDAVVRAAQDSANGVEIAEIPRSGHWPMYSNPVAMWDRIARLHTRNTPP